MPRPYGNSRQFNTVFVQKQGRSRWKPLRVLCHQIDDKADPRLGHEVAAADPEAANLDQPGQSWGRVNPHFSVTCGEMNTVVPDQDSRRDLSGATGRNQIECQTGLAGP